MAKGGALRVVATRARDQLTRREVVGAGKEAAGKDIQSKVACSGRK
jgi:hypothetical protein